MDLFSSDTEGHRKAPLAERVRPAALEHYVGQHSILGEGTLLRRALESGVLRQSMILWGPPGCGKTTLARLIARRVDNRFMPFSAVTSGIGDVKRVIADAKKLRTIEEAPLLLFVDEIHRFNKAQQDAFLPHIEDGTIVFVGATTENPSFEVIGPLLSRSRVFVLEALAPEDVVRILERAMTEAGGPLSSVGVDDGVLEFIADQAQGDARIGLNALDYISSVVERDAGAGVITAGMARDALQRRTISSDKAGESHFNLVSALHKSLRGGDADAGLYWLARMCEAGEDPMFIARRLVRFASEDVGNADPQALQVSIAAKEAVAFIGYPECKLALAQCVTYLALAPKSNALYRAYGEAAKQVHGAAPYPVPMHIRNAPTPLMKDLGYGKGYVYTHDDPDAPQDFLPDELQGRRFYEPGDAGLEADLARRLEAFRKRRER